MFEPDDTNSVSGVDDNVGCCITVALSDNTSSTVVNAVGDNAETAYFQHYMP